MPEQQMDDVFRKIHCRLGDKNEVTEEQADKRNHAV